MSNQEIQNFQKQIRPENNVSKLADYWNDKVADYWNDKDKNVQVHQ